jgi:hypothetical protein
VDVHKLVALSETATAKSYGTQQSRYRYSGLMNKDECREWKKVYAYLDHSCFSGSSLRDVLILKCALSLLL